MSAFKLGSKFPRATVTDVHSGFDLSDGPTSPLCDRPEVKSPRLRRESQYRAVADTLDKTIAGNTLRTWSFYFIVTLAVHIAVYIGISKQNLREDLYQIDSPMAKFELFYVTLTAFIIPLVCRFFLKILVAAVAGHLLAERAYSVPSACLLLAVNIRMDPDIHQNILFFRGAEHGVRGVIIMRLISDYIVYLMIPFVSLALLVQASNNGCWMGFDWGWFLVVQLWPSVWSLLAVGYMVKYWKSQQCIRSELIPTTPTILQVATELALVVQSQANDSQPSGKWRHGHRSSHKDGIFQPQLGLVREDECITLTEMLLAMEEEGSVYQYNAMRDF